eukprot:4485624-Amphidinium_carterae.1
MATEPSVRKHRPDGMHLTFTAHLAPHGNWHHIHCYGTVTGLKGHCSLSHSWRSKHWHEHRQYETSSLPKVTCQASCLSRQD